MLIRVSPSIKNRFGKRRKCRSSSGVWMYARHALPLPTPWVPLPMVPAGRQDIRREQRICLWGSQHSPEGTTGLAAGGWGHSKAGNHQSLPGNHVCAGNQWWNRHERQGGKVWELPQLLNKAPRPPRRTVDALGELISRSNQHRGAQKSTAAAIAQLLRTPTPGQSDQHDADCQVMAVGASESPGCPCAEHSPAKASPAAAGPVGGQRATPTGSGPA